MNNWKTFDQIPINRNRDVFVTDFDKVWIRNWVEAELCSGFAKSTIRWMELEMPEVPKKEFHRCNLGNVECWQSCIGILFVRIQGMTFTCFEECNFCPICGFSPKEYKCSYGSNVS